MQKFIITTEEKEKILQNYFRHGLDGPLETFPGKEKRKYIIAGQVAMNFVEGKRYSEKEVNDILRRIHTDFATLRRFLIDYRFLDRSDDGMNYWKGSERDENHT